MPCQADVWFDSGRNALVVNGTIRWDDHCVAAKLMAANPGLEAVYINSAGGDAWAGVQLGRLFAQTGVTAVVPAGGQALSAAGVAALGAPRLRLHGVLGLHRPYAIGAGGPEAVRETVREMRDLLTAAGLPEWRVGLALTLPANQFLLVDARSVNERAYTLAADREGIPRVIAGCAAVYALFGKGGPGSVMAAR